jgi:hypothetical protein
MLIEPTQACRHSHGQRIGPSDTGPVAQLSHVIAQVVINDRPILHRQLPAEALGFVGVVVGGDGADDGEGVGGIGLSARLQVGWLQSRDAHQTGPNPSPEFLDLVGHDVGVGHRCFDWIDSAFRGSLEGGRQVILRVGWGLVDEVVP